MATKLKVFAGTYDQPKGSTNPTTNAQLMEYHENQNDVLKELVERGNLWQSQTAYAVNHVIYLGGGKWAKCVVAGTSGNTEPSWAIGNVTDNNITWSVMDDNHYNGSEKWFNMGNNGVIDLKNGRCLKTSSKTITLPTAPTDCATTITIMCTANLITWGGNIVWVDRTSPEATGDLLMTFYGAGGIWYGLQNGSNFA